MEENKLKRARTVAMRKRSCWNHTIKKRKSSCRGRERFESGTEERAFWRRKNDGDVDDDVEERMNGNGRILKKIKKFWFIFKKGTRRFQFFMIKKKTLETIKKKKMDPRWPLTEK